MATSSSSRRRPRRGAKTTKIGVANLTFAGSQVIEGAKGALVVLLRRRRGRRARQRLGWRGAISGTLGLGINTTPDPVHTKMIVNGTEIAIDARAPAETSPS